MNKLSRKNILSTVTTLLYLALIAKLVGVGLMWYLPSNGISLHENRSYTQKYRRYDFHAMLQPLSTHVQQQNLQKTTDTHPQISASIDSIVLKGLYGTQNKGFAIVAQKTKPGETTLVGVGETYAGYTLKSIGLHSVVFTKNGKDYLLKIDDATQGSRNKYVQNVRSSAQVSGEEEAHKVRRSDIKYYSKHPSKIWKDISISEVFKDGKINGFKVTKVRPHSKMAQLGLQKGDIIIRANNVELNSYKSVMDLYKNIDKIGVLELIVLRNNQEKEILYEIR